MFFEHVYEAVTGRKFIFDRGRMEAKDFNRKYLVSIYEFIEANCVKLNEFPPKWFLEAVKIYSQEIAKNFPNLASKNDEHGKKVWDAWVGKER